MDENQELVRCPRLGAQSQRLQRSSRSMRHGARNDLDGRGQLSEEKLASFANFFLEVCIDQVDFMERLMDRIPCAHAFSGGTCLAVSLPVSLEHPSARHNALFRHWPKRAWLPRSHRKRRCALFPSSIRRALDARIVPRGLRRSFCGRNRKPPYTERR